MPSSGACHTSYLHALSIDDLRCILDGPEMTERMAPFSDIGQSSLTVDQIAAVLQLWGKQRAIVLCLNIVVNGAQLKMPFPLMIGPQSVFTTTTLWRCSAMTWTTYLVRSCSLQACLPQKLVTKIKFYKACRTSKAWSAFLRSMRTKKHLHRSQSTKSPSLAEYLNQVNERTFRDVNPTCVVASVSESTRKIATDNEKLAGYLVGMAREDAGSRCICHQSCKAQGGLPQAHGTRRFPHRRRCWYACRLD